MEVGCKSLSFFVFIGWLNLGALVMTFNEEHVSVPLGGLGSALSGLLEFVKYQGLCVYVLRALA